MDTINSVQFSNHTGYSAGVRGQILDDSQLQELIDGLDANNINKYSHIINGYIGSKYIIIISCNGSSSYYFFVSGAF